ncbi:hypothetical protein ABC347_07980 [Sphingomonas sp. 1P06PA]|uniref:hypothetical protein n=1 Tax=Sphingomonas sp. 1P06PA TaxID=554121 RepID=UPI0039A5A6A1
MTSPTIDRTREAAPCMICGGPVRADRYDPDDAHPEMAMNCEGSCQSIFILPEVKAYDDAGLLAAWNTRATPAVPEGMVLVPREPTEAMIEAARIDIQCRRDCIVSKCTAKAAYAAMIAAAPPAPAVQGWQPIETAPKDGTAFLFCMAGSSPTYIGRYGRPQVSDVTHERCLCYLSYTPTHDRNFFRLGGMIKCGIQATHWMPLPAPPAPLDREGQADG